MEYNTHLRHVYLKHTRPVYSSRSTLNLLGSASIRPNGRYSMRCAVNVSVPITNNYVFLFSLAVLSPFSSERQSSTTNIDYILGRGFLGLTGSDKYPMGRHGVSHGKPWGRTSTFMGNHGVSHRVGGISTPWGLHWGRKIPMRPHEVVLVFDGVPWGPMGLPWETHGSRNSCKNKSNRLDYISLVSP